MIWKRLKKYADEQEKKSQEERPAEGDPHVSFREHLVMVLTAYAVIVIPCLLILIGLCLLASWLFGLL